MCFKNRNGFTFIEILVALVIAGILAATASVFISKMYWEKAVTLEMQMIARNILEGQINYAIENGAFWPEEGGTILIAHDEIGRRDEVKQALKLDIPMNLKYDVTITASDAFVIVVASSLAKAFTVVGTVDDLGEIKIN